MKIRLLIAGKIENQNADALAQVYLKRIKHYVPISIDIIKPEKMKSLSDAEILNREGQKFLQKISSSDYTAVMDKGGKQITSNEFAKLFNRLAGQSTKQITFVIGGPLGLSDDVKKKADQLLSFSKMTFPHELAFVMLLEQIYRAQSILKGEKYHK
jgi:23S rRNA (pseudouridine1915-N3)-methyltransferase